MVSERELKVVVSAKDEASSKLSQMATKIQDGMKKASIAAGAVGIAMGAFVLSAVKGLGDLGEELDNTVQKTGASAGSLSSFKVAADAMGLSLDSVSGAMFKMNNNINTATQGNDTMKKSFQDLGFKMSDFKGMKTEEVFLNLGNAIAKIDDPVKRTAAAMDVFGKSGGDLLPIFQGGNASLDGFAEAAKKAGLYMDEVSMDKALKMDEAFDSLSASAAGIKQEIAIGLAPVITGLVEKIKPVLESMAAWIAQHPDLTAKITIITAAVLAFIAILWPLTLAIGGVATALAFVAANPIVLVIAALAALAAAVTLMIVHWDAVKAKALEVWGKIADFMVSKFIWIGEQVVAFGEKIKGVWEGFTGYLRDTWAGTWDAISSKVQSIISSITGFIDGLIGRVTKAIDAVKNLAKAALGIDSSGGAEVRSPFSGKTSVPPHKASGGTIYPGQSGTIVGEHGAEYLAAGTSGRIVPNGRLGGGGMVLNLYVTGNTLLSNDVAERMGNMLMDKLRLQNRLS